MKIILLVGYPFAENVIRNRITPILRELLNREYECLLLDYRSHREPKQELAIERETFYSFPYKTSSSIKRLIYEFLNLISFGLKYAQMRMMSRAGEVLFVSIPSMLFIFAGLFSGRSKTTVLDVRDLTWEYILTNSRITGGNIFRRLILWGVGRYDFVLCSNQKEVDYFSSHGLDMDKLALYSNGIESQKFQVISKINRVQRGQFNILYVGNIGVAQNLEPLIDATKDLSNTNLTIIGDGMHRVSLAEKIINEGIRNVELLGPKDWYDILAYYETADLLYFSLESNYRSAVPSKMYEYLSIGCPVLFLGPIGACSSLMERFNIAYFIDIEQTMWQQDLERTLLMLKDSKRSFDDNVRTTENRRLIEKFFIREESAFAAVEATEKIFNKGKIGGRTTL